MAYAARWDVSRLWYIGTRLQVTMDNVSMDKALDNESSSFTRLTRLTRLTARVRVPEKVAPNVMYRPTTKKKINRCVRRVRSAVDCVESNGLRATSKGTNVWLLLQLRPSAPLLLCLFSIGIPRPSQHAEPETTGFNRAISEDTRTWPPGNTLLLAGGEAPSQRSQSSNEVPDSSPTRSRSVHRSYGLVCD